MITDSTAGQEYSGIEFELTSINYLYLELGTHIQFGGIEERHEGGKHFFDSSRMEESSCMIRHIPHVP